MIAFTLVEVPAAPPFACPCGNGIGASGPYVSTALSLGGFELFLCASCARQVMGAFEVVEKSVYDELGERVSRADRRVVELEAELADAQRGLVDVGARERRYEDTIEELRAESRAVSAAAAEMRRELDALMRGQVPLSVARNLAALSGRSTAPVRTSKAASAGKK